MKKVDINIEVSLNEQNVPQELKWKSDDPPSSGKYAEAKAFFLSIFDANQLETLKIDLWTEKFEVGEINRMMFYTLKGLADSYHKATGNQEMSNDMARFAQYFGEELGLIKKSE